MDFLDIESFRSKYSDITVTAVPSGGNSSTNCNVQKDGDPSMDEPLLVEEPPRVEITRVEVVGGSNGGGHGSVPPPQTSNEMDLKNAATAYAMEYKQVMDKLEHTRYLQAQLQLLTLANGGRVLDNGLFDLIPSGIANDPTANIVDKYSNILATLASMKMEISPTLMGARGPRERLLRDIAHARILVRECIMLIERDQQQEEQQQ
ncbi:uncharacterized protein Dwil_GK18226 [Drosophila willistoni]|uniref:Uncharacterized protein n=1 Tax=Drosophila willistoni TaxID=7260 RepID=B4MYW0_DROWI|nr:uncharacterized protein LOC6643655 [Drosophila willistoni]EDW77299.1 uncharacterized protein Dwil_GK18226 [Drosophila willistoni]